MITESQKRKANRAFKNRLEKVSSFPHRSTAEIQIKLFRERGYGKLFIKKEHGKYNTYATPETIQRIK